MLIQKELKTKQPRKESFYKVALFRVGAILVFDASQVFFAL